jgi:hypothetical protein
MRFVFTQMRRPRNPLLQLLLGLAALGLLLFFSVFALFAAVGVMAVIGLARAWRALTGRPVSASSAASPGSVDVIEGEFTVVRDKSAPPAQHIHYTR